MLNCNFIFNKMKNYIIALLFIHILDIYLTKMSYFLK